MTVLRSYVGGAWTEPADEGRPVLDAVTGEEVARVSSAGIDLAAALDYGRSAGGPALRELTFHQRAALLKSLGQLLREHRQELYALSARTGATLGDARFDVDGGIGVLLSYASRAVRYAVWVAGLTRLGTPAMNAGANFSSGPQTGKLNALIWTATPCSGVRMCWPTKVPPLPSGSTAPSVRMVSFGSSRRPLEE